MAKDVVYLRYPVYNGGYGFIQVDPSRVPKGMLNALFIKERVKGGDVQYRPYHLTIDESMENKRELPLVFETLDEIFYVLESALLELGSSELKLNVQECLRSHEHIENLIIAVLQSNEYKAVNSIRDGLYPIIVILSELVKRYMNQEKTVSGMHVAIEIAQKTLDTSSAIKEDLIKEWASSANSLCQIIDEVNNIENSLEIEKQKLSSEITSLIEIIDDEKDIEKMIVHFYGDKNSDGFFLQVFQILNKTNKMTDEFYLEYLSALKIFEDYQKISLDLKDLWDGLLKRKGNLFEFRRKNLGVTESLIRVTNDFRKTEERWGTGTLRPYEFENGLYISKSNYERAVNIFNNYRFAPLTCRQRIERYIDSILDLFLSEPTFSSKYIELMDELSRHLTNLNPFVDEFLKLENVNTSLSDFDEVEKEKIISQISNLDNQNNLVIENSIDENRLFELYEIIICIGQELTCNSSYLSKSTVRSMLRVAHLLDKCTKQESDSYIKLINDIFVAKDMFIVDDSKNVNVSWKTTQCMWISYFVKDQYGIKLAEQKFLYANELMKKYNLTNQIIREAYNENRKIQDELYKQQKLKRQK